MNWFLQWKLPSNSTLTHKIPKILGKSQNWPKRKKKLIKMSKRNKIYSTARQMGGYKIYSLSKI